MWALQEKQSVPELKNPNVDCRRVECCEAKLTSAEKDTEGRGCESTTAYARSEHLQIIIFAALSNCLFRNTCHKLVFSALRSLFLPALVSVCAFCASHRISLCHLPGWSQAARMSLSHCHRERVGPMSLYGDSFLIMSL
jgi:hypothetical protein